MLASTAGRRTGPLHPPPRLMVAFLLLAVAIAAVGIVSFQVISRLIERGEHQQLQTAVELKGQQVETWLARTLTLTDERANTPLFVRALQDWRRSGNPESEALLKRHLASMQGGVQTFAGITLLAPSGTRWLVAGEAPHYALDELRDLLQQSDRLTIPLLIDLHRHLPSGDTRLAIVAPVRLRDPKTDQILGYLVFVVDPTHNLYPLIQDWPRPSATGEMLIFRREKLADREDVVYLSPARHWQGPPLSLRERLGSGAPEYARSSLPGLFKGDDYRDIPVLAATRTLRGTPWILLAKIDDEEVFAGIRTVAAFSLFLVFAALSGVGTLFTLLWRQQRLQHVVDTQTQLEQVTAALPGALVSLRLQAAGGAQVIYASSTFAEIYGTDPGSLADDPEAILATLHPADTESFRSSVALARLGRRPWYGEWRVDHPAKGEVWIEGRAQPYPDPEGDGAIWHGFMQDVTERKANELAQAENAQHFRNIADSGHVFIWTSDTNKLRDYFNLPWLTFTGRSLRQEIGDGWRSVLHPDDLPRCLATYAERCDRRQPFSMEYRARAANGEYRWILEEGSPRYDREGNFLGYVGYGFDITDRKRNDAKIIQLSLAIEQSPECVVITDLNANIEYVNEAFLRKTGYRREEVIGRNPRILQSGSTPPATYQELWQALQADEAWKGEFHNRSRDGQEYIELALISPIRDADGKTTHYLAVKEDITEKKRLAEELDRHRHHLEELVRCRTTQLRRALEAAETANQAKSAFVANMSHEIRTPMNAIIGLTHLLLRGDLAPEQADKLKNIDTAAQHLLSIINDILDLSKIEAGRLELEKVDFSVAALFDEVVMLIGDSARAKGLQVTVDHAGLPANLKGDPGRLRQALLNYAANAVKFTQSGGITLRARIADSGVDVENRGFLVRFEVEDTGIGVPEDARTRLFNAFEQADSSTTRRFGGTGLGLAITRRLAELMEGEAGVDGAPGGGSVFWFTAFLRHGETEAKPAKTPINSERELSRIAPTARLLLVEDNVVNQQVALDLLRSVGLSADTAGDGRQAVSLAAGKRYDLILMDIQMPDMDGFGACRAIRDLPGYGTVPIIAISANVFDDNAAAYRAAGMDDFVVKPVEPERFFATLLHWLPQSGKTEAAKPPSGGGDWHCLEAIPGLDCARGRLLFPGKPDKYLNLLRVFTETHKDDGDHLRAWLDAGNYDALQGLAHRLKGSGGNLGASEVHAAAESLFRAIAENTGSDDIVVSALRLESVLRALIEAVSSIADASKVEGAAPSASSTELLARLETLLRAGDPEATRLVTEESEALRKTLGAASSDLICEHTAACDYRNALRCLQATMNDNESAASA